MWTNVARTSVAGTNVTLTVRICSRCSHEPMFKVSSKSGILRLTCKVVCSIFSVIVVFVVLIVDISTARPGVVFLSCGGAGGGAPWPAEQYLP